jgi:hypothetical protein
MGLSVLYFPFSKTPLFGLIKGVYKTKILLIINFA